MRGNRQQGVCWEVEARWALVRVSHQQLQVSLSGFEYLRVRVSQVFCVVQVGDGEVDSKRHQERNCSCNGKDSKMRPVLSQAWADGGS